MMQPAESATTQLGSTAVKQLHELLHKMERMDYYQIIGVDARADTRDIRKKFYARSKRYHPDRYHYVHDPEFKQLVTNVYKQISEAYNILKEPQVRTQYDQALAKDRTAHLKFKPGDDTGQKEYDGGSGPGAKYYRLAKQSLAAGNASSARNNIKLALMMESGNEHFLELQKTIQEKS